MELTEPMLVAPHLQRQVLTLDGATGPPPGSGPVRTSLPNRLGGTESCEDRGRLLLLAETKQAVEAAKPSGAELIPRSCALQEQAALPRGSGRVACYSKIGSRHWHSRLDPRCTHARVMSIGAMPAGGSVRSDCGLRSPRACRGDRGRAAQTWELSRTRVYQPVKR